MTDYSALLDAIEARLREMKGHVCVEYEPCGCWDQAEPLVKWTLEMVAVYRAWGAHKVLLPGDGRPIRTLARALGLGERG